MAILTDEKHSSFLSAVMNIKTITALLTAVLLCAGMNQARADEYCYCIAHKVFADDGTLGGGVYYSAIFLYDYSNINKAEWEFRSYLKQREGFTPGTTVCLYGDSYQEAKREIEYSKISYRNHYRDTNWSPDNFTEQPLRDFNIRVSGSQQEVRICVRDHECEDGDKVRVSVNGDRVFSGEIDNQWACADVEVRSGSNSIEMYAINGTGHKGPNCAHNDVNTGEIRVEGKNIQSQSWRHRGGAGSKANLNVEID